MFDKLLDRFSNDKSKLAKRKAVVAGSGQYAPNTKIAYKPTLVPTLEKEHRQILSLYWKALTAAQNQKTEQTKMLLVELKDALVEHILKENTSLYIYLRNSAKKPSSQEAVKSVKSEMDEIARDVMRFFEKAISEDIEINAGFVEKLKHVGDLLTLRIEKEEAFVYPNYKPN